MAITKKEGQIWIDKEAPHRLKYHAFGTDYETMVASTYKVDSATDTIKRGMLVALNSSNKLKKASFPQDIDTVLGVATEDSTVGIPISIITEGSIVVDSSVIKNYASSNAVKGAPVYWYIGEYGSTYSDSDRGLLTLRNPVGLGSDETAQETSKDITFLNLPKVGNISEVNDSKITIILNFSEFSNVISWGFPSKGDGKIAPSSLTDNVLTLKTGLISQYATNDICSIEAKVNSSDAYNIRISTVSEDIVSSGNTNILIKTEDTMYYHISGRVSYNTKMN